VRTVALLLALSLPLWAPVDNLQVRAAQFDVAWVRFVVPLYGCREVDGKVDWGACRPGQGVVDARAWKRAREAAKVLFELEDRQP